MVLDQVIGMSFILILYFDLCEIIIALVFIRLTVTLHCCSQGCKVSNIVSAVF